MAELIDRAALRKAIMADYGSVSEEWGENNYQSGLTTAIVSVDDAPTIDAVPVVRCGKCDLWEPFGCKQERGACDEWSDYEHGVTRYTWRNDFCSRGKPRVEHEDFCVKRMDADAPERIDCFGCDCYDTDREGCTMPSVDMDYACPLTADAPERAGRICMDRLTKNFNGAFGLVKVKDNEQEIESPYRNTLQACFESWQRLGQYEDTGLTPDEIAALRAELAAMTAERDALINVQAQLNGVMCGVRAERDAFKARAEAAERDLMIGKECGTCKHADEPLNEPPCEGCMDNGIMPGYEWRGPKEDKP